MRKRIAAAMTALALLLFPLGAMMIVSRSFALSMEQERARALSEESAIARALALEIGVSAEGQALFSVAQGVQSRYGSESLQVILIYHGAAMAGRELPEGLDELLQTEGRATLLSGEAQKLYIAHRLADNLVLLLGSDVSAVYALRQELAVWAGLLSLAGVALSALLSVLVSGWLAKPYKRLAQQRQELIDALAHEMRTPLTAILGGARLLERASLPQEKQNALLSSMAREAQRLSDMDERLLQLTRMEHADVRREAFSSINMAREALSVFEGVELCGDDAVFHAERELTIQLLRNLVVNALRAGGDEPVVVTLLSDGFSVEDHGCGMTKEQLNRAFEPFYKADKARSRSHGGAGMGLTISKRIADLHDGSLSMNSEPGRGTKVVYHFDTTL